VGWNDRVAVIGCFVWWAGTAVESGIFMVSWNDSFCSIILFAN